MEFDREKAERLAMLNGNWRDEWGVVGFGVGLGVCRPEMTLVMGAFGEFVEVGRRTGMCAESLARMCSAVIPWLFHDALKPNWRVGVAEFWWKVVAMKDS